MSGAAGWAHAKCLEFCNITSWSMPQSLAVDNGAVRLLLFIILLLLLLVVGWCFKRQFWDRRSS